MKAGLCVQGPHPIHLLGRAGPGTNCHVGPSAHDSSAPAPASPPPASSALAGLLRLGETRAGVSTTEHSVWHKRSSEALGPFLTGLHPGHHFCSQDNIAHHGSAQTRPSLLPLGLQIPQSLISCPFLVARSQLPCTEVTHAHASPSCPGGQCLQDGNTDGPSLGSCSLSRLPSLMYPLLLRAGPHLSSSPLQTTLVHG